MKVWGESLPNDVVYFTSNGLSGNHRQIRLTTIPAAPMMAKEMGTKIRRSAQAVFRDELQDRKGKRRRRKFQITNVFMPSGFC